MRDTHELLRGRRRILGKSFAVRSTPPLGGWESVMRTVIENDREIRHIRGLRRRARLPIRGQRTKSNGLTARRLGLMGGGGPEKTS